MATKLTKAIYREVDRQVTGDQRGRPLIVVGVLAWLLLGAALVMAQPVPCGGGLATPRCDDDRLCWDEVVDPDLAGYVIRERMPGQSGWLDEVAVGPAEVSLLVGCRAEVREFAIWSLDLAGQESTNASLLEWAPGTQWDEVVETRPECSPPDCRRICIAWETRVIDGMAIPVCVQAHREPPGCVECLPPIGGLGIWVPAP